VSGFDINMYREMFAEEAEELFDTLDNVLLEAEEQGDLSDEQMIELFRAMHTLKGSGSSVELQFMTKLAHKTEDFMDKLRNHEIAYQAEMASLLIDCTDTLKELLEMEMDDSCDEDTFQSKTSHLMSQLETYLSGNAPAPAAPAEEPAAAAEPEPVAQESATPAEEATDSSNFGLFTDDTPSDGDEGTIFGFFNDSSKAPTKVTATVADDGGAFGFFNTTPRESELKAEEVSEAPTPKPAAPAPAPAPKAAPAPAAKPVEQKAAPKPAAPAPTPAPKAAAAPAAKPTGGSAVKKPGAAGAEGGDRKAASKSAASNTIRVNLTKIDALMNNVGELVITNAMLSQFATSISDQKVQDSIMERLELLTRHIRELQESIMSIRMVPMENIYSKFPKVIRDIAKKLNKKVEFKHFGDNVEIDKAMIEGLTDPLMHIIRNSMDHGLEMPEERKESGKPETGTITIAAEQSNGQIIISIKDDGKGINIDTVVNKAITKGVITEDKLSSMTDEDKAMLIFEAGLSTAEAITDLSGRGVGMDVVKTNINKLGGVVRIDTKPTIGTTITFVLPLTLAILDGLDVAVGDTRYILPLNAIVESLQPKADMIKRIGDGGNELLMLREEFIPIVRLYKLFNEEPKYSEPTEGMLIVVKSGNHKVAMFVDEFLDQHQVVVKPLDKNFRNVQGVGAATVRGDGTIGLILDVMGLIEEQKRVEEFKRQAKSVA
jgi:two-component system chemotaxis sensor kinase CheA